MIQCPVRPYNSQPDICEISCLESLSVSVWTDVELYLKPGKYVDKVILTTVISGAKLKEVHQFRERINIFKE